MTTVDRDMRAGSSRSSADQLRTSGPCLIAQLFVVTLPSQARNFLVGRLVLSLVHFSPREIFLEQVVAGERKPRIVILVLQSRMRTTFAL